MRIAVPSDSSAGLDAPISDHFGHCAAFTLVDLEDDAVGEVRVLANAGHEQGGCMGPVMLLKEHGVDALIAAGMGMRPLAGFQEVGIAVHSRERAQSVRDAVELFVAGGCPAFGEAQTCGGGAGACGDHDHHHRQPVVREPVEGTPDVRRGRVVTFDYELRDREGHVVDSSERTGPMEYLHGAGTLLPALEAALTGLEPGASRTVELAAAEAFGEHDEERVISVSRTQLPPEATVGVMVTGRDDRGQQVHLRVLELEETTARLDANHPLAGKDLVFDVTVVKVEAATPEELAAL